MNKFALILLTILTLTFSSCSLVNKIVSPVAVTTDTPTYFNTTIISPNQLILFFPRQGRDPAPELVKLYNSATTSIDVAIYSITQVSISNALISAHNRGIDVKVISDKVESSGSSQKQIIDSLLSVGIPVKIDSHSGIMHLKMSIIDDSIATTGSYNYTEAASNENDEMFLEITNQDFVTSCQLEFNTMWNDNNNFTTAVIK